MSWNRFLAFQGRETLSLPWDFSILQDQAVAALLLDSNHNTCRCAGVPEALGSSRSHQSIFLKWDVMSELKENFNGE